MPEDKLPLLSLVLSAISFFNHDLGTTSTRTIIATIAIASNALILPFASPPGSIVLPVKSGILYMSIYGSVSPPTHTVKTLQLNDVESRNMNCTDTHYKQFPLPISLLEIPGTRLNLFS